MLSYYRYCKQDDKLYDSVPTFQYFNTTVAERWRNAINTALICSSTHRHVSLPCSDAMVEKEEEEEYSFINFTVRTQWNTTHQGDCHAGQYYTVDIYMDLYSAMSYTQGAQTWITQFYLQTTPCLPWFPAAEHHRPLAGTHFTVPRRVEGWVDLVAVVGCITYHMTSASSSSSSERHVGHGRSTSCRATGDDGQDLSSTEEGSFVFSVSR